MYSKIITLFCCLLFLASKNFAEDATSCKAAKDSMKVQFNRNEMGFFTPSRMVSNMFNYFVITKDYYKKVPVAQMNKK